MTKKYYKAKYIVLEDRVIVDDYMMVEDGIIQGFAREAEEGVEVIDFGDAYLAPGLVDTHIHGYKNEDIMDAKKGALNTISKGILEMGVTSFLPTTLTASTEQLNDACRVIGEEHKTVEGAKVRGVFLEGPYFTEKYKGAQNLEYMKDPSIEELKKWKDLSDGLVNKIAIAPERKGVEEFIKEARKMGVYVALGHSDATYEEAIKAVDAGANIFVHTYNAMSGLHHREPGMVGAALNTKTTVGELICDGHHVHPMAAKVVMESKGRDHVALVTDCMRAGGMPDGDYSLGEFPVVVKDGTARLAEGNLAGSILKLKDAVSNVYSWRIATAFEAIQMASLVPAKSVGLDGVCGKLKEGYEADFIVLDEKLELLKTYLDGELKYELKK